MSAEQQPSPSKPANGNGSEQITAGLPYVGNVTAKGPLTPLLLIIAVFMAAMIYIVHTDNIKDADAHDKLEKVMIRLVKEKRISNWIQSLPQDKRPLIPRPMEFDELYGDFNTGTK